MFSGFSFHENIIVIHLPTRSYKIVLNEELLSMVKEKTMIYMYVRHAKGELEWKIGGFCEIC